MRLTEGIGSLHQAHNILDITRRGNQWFVQWIQCVRNLNHKTRIIIESCAIIQLLLEILPDLSEIISSILNVLLHWRRWLLHRHVGRRRGSASHLGDRVDLTPSWFELDSLHLLFLGFLFRLGSLLRRDFLSRFGLRIENLIWPGVGQLLVRHRWQRRQLSFQRVDHHLNRVRDLLGVVFFTEELIHRPRNGRQILVGWNAEHITQNVVDPADLVFNGLLVNWRRRIQYGRDQQGHKLREVKRRLP
mmetsp:Transcript_32921/g.71855  ORF Transcript_32921/g.71855 Transcript_32921/m.71855 type:complete len:246 (-) Transcript_32921:576-1313(-)